MASVAAPVLPQVSDQFRPLVRRIRLARLLRGLGTLAVALAAVFLAAFLVDRIWGLTTLSLQVAFALFAGTALVTVVLGVILPQWRLPGPPALAALIEKQYPELGERLSTAVHLRDDPAHGAQPLVHLLCADAAARCRDLDLAAAYSLEPLRKLGIVTALCVLAGVVPAVVSPAYAHFGVRFFRACFDPLVGYALAVTPGDAYLARGRPAVISARLIQEDPETSLPNACFVVLHEEQGLRRVRMQSSGGEYAFTIEKLPGDVTYHVEAGERASPVHRLSAVTPVEALSATPLVRVTPPSYVDPKALPQPESHGDFAALQYSVIHLSFRLNRTPATAAIVWQKNDAPAPHTKVSWSQEKPEATVEILAGELGTFTGTLVLEAEHGIRTQVALPRWKVWGDEAPLFLERPSIPASAIGENLETSWQAAPHDPLRLRALLEDTVGLDRLEIEYRLGDGPVQTFLLGDAKDKLQLGVDTFFPLAGKVKDGDVFRFRLRAQDNRRLPKDALALGIPALDLTPHVVHDPAPKDGKDRWYVLKIASQADSLQKQEIVAQRDDLNRLLENIKKKIHLERAHLGKVKLASHQGQITAEHLRQLSQLRGLHRDVTLDLGRFARQALVVPALEALAERALDVADKEMAQGDQHLARAEEKVLPLGEREKRLQDADQELVKALARLEDLAKLNERLAQDRLDQAQMERLAQQQEELARQAKELAARDPKTYPDLEKELAKLRAEQEKIAQELKRLSEKSQLFREALQKFRVAEAKMLADKSRDLAQAQKTLAQASEDTLLKELQSRLAELAKKQADLAGRGAKLGAEAKKPGPFLTEAEQAAHALEQAQVAAALKLQEQSSHVLQQLAGELERDALLSKSPREAARKLAAMQQQIHGELEKLGEDVPRLNDKQIRQRLLDILEKQKSLADAVDRWNPSNASEAARRAKEHAVQETRKAEEYLRTKDAFTAYKQMEEALRALQQLAGQAPPTPPAEALAKETAEEKAARERMARALELAKEQKELQDAVRKAVQEVLQAPAPKRDDRLAKLLQEQADVAGQVAALAKQLDRALGKNAPPSAAEAMEASHEASERALAGAFGKAEEEGKKAAGKLHELAKGLANEKMAGAMSQQAGKLAQRQEALNEAFAEMSRDLAAQKAQQKEREKELRAQTEELMKDLLQLAQQANSDKGMHGAKEAAESAMQALKALEKGMQAKDEGKPDLAKEMSKEAELKLELAGKQAEQSAAAMQADAKMTDENAQARDETGADLKNSEKQVDNARMEIKKGATPGAQQAMQQAAQAMQKTAQSAAKQMSKGSQSSKSKGNKGQDPNRAGVAAGGLPSLFLSEKELETHAGKSWGQLPGELKTRLLQDLRARFGDDYGPIIQRYFQQLADTPERKR